MEKIYCAMLGALSLSLPAWSETVEVNSFSEIERYSEEISENLTLKIGSDFTVEDHLRLPGNVTIDLNGHTLWIEGNISVSGTDVLTVSDSNEEEPGGMVTVAKGIFIVAGNGMLKVERGRFSAEDTNPYPLISVMDYAGAEINGGFFERPSHSYVVENTGSLSVNGGTFVAPDRSSLALILTVEEGVTRIQDGAFYAGNMTAAKCFDTVSYSSGEYEETATLILPEGVFDGGAVVLDGKWAIPGTYYINYILPEGAEMQPGMHYFRAGDSFPLPECNRREGIPFAGWSRVDANQEELITEVSPDMAENLEIYPIWKYTDISDGVSVDLVPLAVNPQPGSTLAALESVTLRFSDQEEMDLYVRDDIAAKASVEKMSWGSPSYYTGVRLSASWDGSLTVTFDRPLEENGEYRIFIPAGSVGNDDYEYGDYVEGRCNPDIFLTYYLETGAVSDKGVYTDPENGSTVGSLETIRFIFEDDTVMYEYGKEGTLTNEAGDLIATVTAMECSYDGSDIVMTIPQAITAAGTYKLELPAGFFGYDWGETPIAATEFTWIVDGNVAVSDVMTKEVVSRTYYDLNGHPVSADTEGVVIEVIGLSDGTVKKFKRICKCKND